MSLKTTLKNIWNRVCCEMDAAGSPLFISKAVNEEMEKQGWKVDFNHHAPMVPARAAAISIPVVTNPRGEKVTTAAQFREYDTARRQAARKVYGLK